jgi:hypothetical protein
MKQSYLWTILLAFVAHWSILVLGLEHLGLIHENLSLGTFFSLNTQEILGNDKSQESDVILLVVLTQFISIVRRKH